MQVLFVIDPIDSLRAYKDTSVTIMRAAQQRGHTVACCTLPDLWWEPAHHSMAKADFLDLPTDTKNEQSWYVVQRTEVLPLSAFDCIAMRKDPPVEQEYVYGLQLLALAQQQEVIVVNDPMALCQYHEKLAILSFDSLIPPTLVTKRLSSIAAFHAQHKDVIVKPLDGMGGQGIFRIKANGLNLPSIVETLGHNGSRTLMVQQYLPAIENGDKRVLVINGKIVPFCLARIPKPGEVRGNLAAGGRGVAQPIGEIERTIAQTVADRLSHRGLFLMGLDIIGDQLTEINVTSPTCFQEITQQTGFDVAEFFIKELESLAP